MLDEKRKRSVNAYAKYSALAFQMFFTIALAVWGGIKLDDYLKWKFPLFTVLFAFISVIGVMVIVIRSLRNP